MFNSSVVFGRNQEGRAQEVSETHGYKKGPGQGREESVDLSAISSDDLLSTNCTSLFSEYYHKDTHFQDITPLKGRDRRLPRGRISLYDHSDRRRVGSPRTTGMDSSPRTHKRPSTNGQRTTSGTGLPSSVTPRLRRVPGRVSCGGRGTRRPWRVVGP